MAPKCVLEIDSSAIDPFGQAITFHEVMTVSIRRTAGSGPSIVTQCNADDSAESAGQKKSQLSAGARD
jgi:hypothetical protein